MHVTAIIAAGGRGRRLGAAVPKQLLPIGGRPILEWTVDTFLACDAVTDLVVVAPPDIAAAPPSYLRRPRVVVVVGGERRQDSVANGFDAVAADAEIVLVHDAARPFVDCETIVKAIGAAAEAGAAIVAVPASDTVKLVPRNGAAADARVVERTIERESIFLAQTPQAFRRSVLAQAIALGRTGAEGTDEAALAEQAGHVVRVVEGSRRNIKITTTEDLVVAEALATQMDRSDAALGSGEAGSAEPREPREGRDARTRTAPPSFRIGNGYDLHCLIDGRPLVLGGVTIPHARGLAGHSDADVLAHAVTDAILGAASMGDIGQHFPDTDPRWKDASSIDLLAQVVAMVRARGFRVINVDATVIAERPKLAPYRAAILARLCQALCLPMDCVSLKAKTNEGVDATGRGEAIAVHALALLERQTANSGERTVDHEETT